MSDTENRKIHINHPGNELLFEGKYNRITSPSNRINVLQNMANSSHFVEVSYLTNLNSGISCSNK